MRNAARGRSRVLIAAVGVLVATMAVTHPGHAQVLLVESNLSFTTIAEAIAAASSGNTILITNPVHTEARITVNKNVTIAGLGITNTIVQASASRRDSPGGITVGRIFTMTANNLNVTLRDMMLRHGYTNAHGGAVSSTGTNCTLRLLNCWFLNNDVVGANGGGAVNFQGTPSLLIASNCIFEGNVSTNGNAGAVRLAQNWDTVRAVMDSCTFVSNWCSGSGGAFCSG